MKRLLSGFLFATLLLASRVCSEPRPCTHRTVRITGIISDRDGSILRGARVIYRGLTWNKDCSEGVWKDYKTKANSRGLYSVTGPEQGKLLVVHPDRQRYPPELALSEDFRIGDVRADYQLHIFRVQGHLIAPDGRDAEGVTVYYCHGGAEDLLIDSNKKITTPKFELFLPRDEPYEFLVTRSGMKEFQGFSVTLRSDTSITYSLKPE